MTLEEYFMGRDEEYPPTEEMKQNAQETVKRANALLQRAELGSGFVRSGYRPPEINAKVPGAAPHSKHQTCQAVDIGDTSGTLKRWCMKNLGILEEIGLWMEAPEFTPSWIHLQIVPPRSGRRVFIP